MIQMKFSVLLTVYKNDIPIYFDNAIESILNQTVIPTEVVIVVDGPVPNDIRMVIEKYQKAGIAKFNAIYLETNCGLGEACRIGLENCHNEYVARMDSDDIALKDRFEKQLKVLNENPDIVVVGGQISEFQGKENNIVGYRKVPLSNEDIKSFARFRCPMNHVTVMFRKSAILSVGNYESFPFNEDYYLWIKLLKNDLMLANIPDILVNVRVGEAMYQRRGGKKYFQSELGIQNIMLKNKMINLVEYIFNVCIRVAVQIFFTNKMRQWFFCAFARKRKGGE